MTYHFSYDITNENSFECELEYSPACRGSREVSSGLQMEPDEPEAIELISAEVNGVDVFDYLSENTIEKIEMKALENMRSEENDY